LLFIHVELRVQRVCSYLLSNDPTYPVCDLIRFCDFLCDFVGFGPLRCLVLICCWLLNVRVLVTRLLTVRFGVRCRVALVSYIAFVTFVTGFVYVSVCHGWFSFGLRMRFTFARRLRLPVLTTFVVRSFDFTAFLVSFDPIPTLLRRFDVLRSVPFAVSSVPSPSTYRLICFRCPCTTSSYAFFSRTAVVYSKALHAFSILVATVWRVLTFVFSRYTHSFAIDRHRCSTFGLFIFFIWTFRFPVWTSFTFVLILSLLLVCGWCRSLLAFVCLVWFVARFLT